MPFIGLKNQRRAKSPIPPTEELRNLRSSQLERPGNSSSGSSGMKQWENFVMWNACRIQRWPCMCGRQGLKSAITRSNDNQEVSALDGCFFGMVIRAAKCAKAGPGIQLNYLVNVAAFRCHIWEAGTDHLIGCAAQRHWTKQSRLKIDIRDWELGA